MEWLLAHEDELENTLILDSSVTKPAEGEKVATETSENVPVAAAEEGAEAKSLKCDECGRLFKNQLEVEFHAAKSGNKIIF